MKYVDRLNQEELEALNKLLPWTCFTLDHAGRRLGGIAREGKRDTPQEIPDARIKLLDETIGLRGKHALEFGCYEGVHTIGLSMFAKAVTAVDSRVENVVKTLARCAMYGYFPQVFCCDLENREALESLPHVDVLHHVGVLYHLRDPVSHLLSLGRFVSDGLILDTHYAEEKTVDGVYEVGGRSVKYRRYKEGGRPDVFSGMYDHSKWLLLDDMVTLLGETGFAHVKIVEQRAERNGPRVLLFARKTPF